MKRKRSTLIIVLIVVTLIIAIVPMLTVQADFGTNWTGTFFNSTNLSGTGVPVSNINGLNFNWGTGEPVINGVPVPGMGADNFSARFTSTQNLTPGHYSFVVSSDDGVRLYVNGLLALDKFVGRALTTDTVSVTITSSPVNLTVEYFEGIDQAILQVQWFLVSVIPQTATPTAAVPLRNYFEVRSVPLSWNRLSWAAGYEVQVATDTLFTHIVWKDATLSADTLSISTPDLGNRRYFWRVRAKVNATIWGGWSVIGAFTVHTLDFGTNWSGTFFASNDLTGTGVLITGIAGLNFNWGIGAPVIDGVAVPGIPDDNFSARFTSVQTFAAGTYTFTAASDDGIRVYIDGDVRLDRFVGRTLTQDSFNTTLTAGPHSVVVEYFEGLDQAILQVQWFLN
ncbi:MAG: PA14 domain-containing protein [Chloroflexota bacterium]